MKSFREQWEAAKLAAGVDDSEIMSDGERDEIQARFSRLMGDFHEKPMGSFLSDALMQRAAQEAENGS